MKKNLLFSIALCIGLTLPSISFGSEPQAQGTVAWIQSVIQQATQDFSSYMSDFFGENAKYVLLAALIIPGWIFLETRKPRNQEREEIHRLLSKIAEKYDIAFYPSYVHTHPQNINTVARFLSHEEWHNWKQYKQKAEIQQSYKAEDLADIEGLKTDNPRTIFKWCIFPILQGINIPAQLTNNPTAQETQEYAQKNKDLWIEFMRLVRTNNAHILLSYKNNYYFKIIQGYLSTIPGYAQQHYAESIDYAIDENQTISSTPFHQESATPYSGK